MEIAYDISLRYAKGALSESGLGKEQHYSIQSGDTVVEMGAYQGMYCMSASKKVGPTGKVIGIEAIPDNVRLFRKNLAKNDITNVHVAETGVWHKEATMVFKKDPLQGQSASAVLEPPGGDSLEIQVRPLSKILENLGIREVNFMVIQLNGAEPNALQGLGPIRPRHMALASRYNNEHGSTTPQIMEWLEENGYNSILEHNKFIFAKYEGP